MSYLWNSKNLKIAADFVVRMLRFFDLIARYRGVAGHQAEVIDLWQTLFVSLGELHVQKIGLGMVVVVYCGLPGPVQRNQAWYQKQTDDSLADLFRVRYYNLTGAREIRIYLSSLNLMRSFYWMMIIFVVGLPSLLSILAL